MLVLAVIIQIIGPKGQIVYSVQGDTGSINYKKRIVKVQKDGVKIKLKYPKDHFAIIFDLEKMLLEQIERMMQQKSKPIWPRDQHKHFKYKV